MIGVHINIVCVSIANLSGIMPGKRKKKEEAYVVHGLKYLSSETKSSEKRQLRSDGLLLDANKHGASQQNTSLYVSSDWTESLFDQASLDEVDWTKSDCYPYENIVMSGGGSKGYAFIGALKVGLFSHF